MKTAVEDDIEPENYSISSDNSDDRIQQSRRSKKKSDQRAVQGKEENGAVYIW